MTDSLVTGGEGFIGSRILAETGAESFDLKSGQDILNQAQLARAVQGKKTIWHCAARISVPESVAKPEEYFQTNVAGTKSVISVAEGVGAKIIFSSSAAVYGEASYPVSEREKLNPTSPYAENKREAEKLLRQADLPSVILRYFNVYGPGQSDAYAGVVSIFIKRALRNEDLIICGNGEQVRDFVFISDVVRANILAQDYSGQNGEIFNIASGTRTSVINLAKLIIELTKSKSEIIFQPARAGDIVYSQADVSKAREVLGWQAETSLEAGLRETIDSVRTGG